VLLWHSWMDGSNMTNDGSEIHGSCRHRARFCRSTIQSSANDPDLGERLWFARCFKSWFRLRLRVFKTGVLAGSVA
jgi:hypothetical protein